MKRTLIVILLIALVGCIGYIVLQKNGYNDRSIQNLPETIGLQVNCSEPQDIVVSKQINVSITNSSSREHRDVTVRITGYDAEGNLTKEKTSKFERALGPGSSISKPITLPYKTYTCKCVIESSNPQ